jgi:hypothetical protein
VEMKRASVEYSAFYLLINFRNYGPEGASFSSLHYLDGFIKFPGFESGYISDLHSKYGIRKCASFQTSEWQGRRIFPASKTFSGDCTPIPLQFASSDRNDKWQLLTVPQKVHNPTIYTEIVIGLDTMSLPMRLPNPRQPTWSS